MVENCKLSKSCVEESVILLSGKKEFAIRDVQWWIHQRGLRGVGGSSLPTYMESMELSYNFRSWLKRRRKKMRKKKKRKWRRRRKKGKIRP